MPFQTPNVDFNLFVINQLPQSKRKLYWITYFKYLISQVVYVYDICFSYINGSSAGYFDISFSYDKDAEVVYKYKVYKSKVSGNIGNNPELSTNEWREILPSPIGLQERSRFEGKKLKLEYALNRYFKKEIEQAGFVGFVQPDDNINPTNSTIYIITNDLIFPSFLIGETEQYCSQIGGINSSGWIGEIETFGTDTPFLFIIRIPIFVYVLIGGGISEIADSIIRNFVDKLNASGIYYTIELY